MADFYLENALTSHADHIDVSHVALGNEQVIDLLQLLSDQPSITVLTLTCVGATSSCSKQFVEALKQTHITTLFLDHNDLSDEFMIELANGLTEIQIQLLSLIGCNIGDEGITAFSNALPGCSSLQKLYLSDNNVTDDGATALSEALKADCSLQALYLSGNLISDVGVVALAEGLHENSHLTHLDIGRQEEEVGVPSGLALADMLSINSTLESLNLAENTMSYKAIMPIAQVGWGFRPKEDTILNTTLKTIDLRRNPLVGRFLQDIADAWHTSVQNDVVPGRKRTGLKITLYQEF